MTFPIAVFIFFIITIHLLRKRRKGLPLDKTDVFLLALAVVGLIIDSFALVLTYFQWADVTPITLQPIQPYVIEFIITLLFIGTPIIVLAGVIFYESRQKMGIAEFKNIFRDVTIWFPFNNYNSDEYYKYDPKYITNNRTHKAYLISPDFIEKYVRNQYITSKRTFPTETKLKNELNKGYSPIPKVATLRDLDIFSRPDVDCSLLRADDAVSDIKANDFFRSKRDQRAFTQYQLILIYPWRFFFSRKLQSKNFPPSNRVLLDVKTRTIRPPPEGDVWLMVDDVFKYVQRTKHFPYEKIGWYCSLHGFPFKRCRFEEDTPYLLQDFLQIPMLTERLRLIF